MYKRIWNPEAFQYEYRNFQTGEGLFSNLKAFGKSALPSRSTISKKAKASASDFYKDQAFKKSKQKTTEKIDKSFIKFRQTRPKRDGKKTILKRLRKSSIEDRGSEPVNRRRPSIEDLSQRISKRLLLLDDD